MEEIVYETMDFRRRKILGLMQDIKKLFSGDDISIIPYVYSESGRYSETRTWNFIKDLVHALEEYGRLNTFWDAGQMPDSLRQYTECYLYCMLRVMSVDSEYFERPEAVFETLSTCANSVSSDYERYSTLYELVHFPDYVITEDVPRYCMPVYELLTGERVLYNLTPQRMRDKMELLYAETLERDKKMMHDSLEDFSESDLDAEEWESVRRTLQEVDEKAPEPEREAMEEAHKQDEEPLDDRNEKTRFLQTFKEADTFVSNYRRYRELHYSGKVEFQDVFAEMVEGMLDVYRRKYEMSLYGDDDAYFQAYSYLNKALQESRELRKEDVVWRI